MKYQLANGVDPESQPEKQSSTIWDGVGGKGLKNMDGTS